MATNSPAHRSTAHGDQAHGSLGLYVVIWLVLLGLTGLTYVLAKAPLHSWHVPVALGIASTKSLLVLAFFMHLKDHSAVNRAFFILSFVFVLTLLGGVIGDVVTRLPTANPNFNPYPEIHGAPAAPGPQGGHAPEKPAH
ncbi:MAG: cytochrome C oxidase subunit IV family protein [Myxococcaceae bacterium]